MRLMEQGTLVTKPSEPELGTGVVAGTYDEDEVLVGWANLEGLTYEYPDELALAENGGSGDETGADKRDAG